MAGEWETVGGGGWETVEARPSSAPAAPQESALMRSAPVGAADTAAALVSGAVAPAVGGLAGLAGAVLPGEPGQGARVAERVQDALTYEPRTKGGKAITGAVAYPFQKLGEGARYAGEKAQDAGAPPSVATAIDTAINAAPMALSPAIKRLPIKKADPKLAANVDKAKGEGYALTPQEAGAGVISKTAASVSGEPKLARGISNKNQATHNRLIAEDLGLPKDATLDRETLAGIRREAGNVYEEVRGLGRIDADPEYGQSLQKIVSAHEGAEKSFPTGKTDPVYSLVESLNQPSFDAGAAVDKIKLLREDSNAAYMKRDTRMGRAYKQAAAAIEDAIDRHLQRAYDESQRQPFSPNSTPPLLGRASPGTAVARAGKGTELSTESARIEKDITPRPEPASPPRVTSELITRWRDARTRIAKSYAAEKALNGETGNINAQVYAKELDKGRPLSGGARTVGEVARAFPRSTQKPSTMATGAGAFDAAMGALSGEWKWALARPAVRKLLESGIVQRFLSPNRPAAELARDIQGNAGVGAAETATGQRE